MSDNENEENPTSIEGFQVDQDYEDFIDSDIVNILFVIFTVIYVISLVIFYAGPVLENPIIFGLLKVMVYWSFFKILLPVINVLFVIFNVTNLPLTTLLLIITGQAAFNSMGFIVIFIFQAVGCNTGSQPTNICNDPLRCCVYYTGNPDVTGCNITDGPCIGSFYPQKTSDLKWNQSFTFYLVMIIIIFLLEFSLLLLSMFLRNKRLDYEKEFWINKKPNRNNQKRNGNSLEKPDIGKRAFKAYQLGHTINMYIGRILHEFKKIPSHSGFTAHMGYNRIKRKRKIN